MHVQKPKCDYKEIIVSNPNGYDLTIQDVIKTTNDPKHLIAALKNPSLTDGTFDCIISKLGLMAIQCYARDAVISEVLTTALEVPKLTKESLKTIEDSLTFVAQNHYASDLIVANVSVMIEAKRAELSRGR